MTSEDPVPHAPAASTPPAAGTRIDLNADLGESFGAWRMGDDAALLAQVTSANIACGFHAGDPAIMQQTVALAVAPASRSARTWRCPTCRVSAGARCASARPRHTP
jgi:hypothetical protein